MATNPRYDATTLVVPEPPRLPSAPSLYEVQYQEQFNNVLRLYFNRLNNFIQELSVADGTTGIYPTGTAADAFGRLRSSMPYTIFDSQNRYGADPQFDGDVGTGCSITHSAAESTTNLNVGTTSGEKAIRQTLRRFPYQPGKSLLIMATFVMSPNAGPQRVGYFDDNNGVFFQRTAAINYFVLLPGTGAPTRTVAQADWNGDKLDGTGVSGLTLDPTKSQILFMDFEWLGVGSVRCGFVIDGTFHICHTFNNANVISAVYMTTAILPIRYEITSSGQVATMKQVCSTVISEGGYEQGSKTYFARRDFGSPLGSISTTALPMLSIRLVESAGVCSVPNAVVLPQILRLVPDVSQQYEITMVKHDGSLLGGTPSWSTIAGTNVQIDTAASSLTTPTADQIVYLDYVTSSGSGGINVLHGDAGYNWSLQPGVFMAAGGGVANSEVLTVAVRTQSSSPSGSMTGALGFLDITATA